MKKLIYKEGGAEIRIGDHTKLLGTSIVVRIACIDEGSGEIHFHIKGATGYPTSGQTNADTIGAEWIDVADPAKPDYISQVMQKVDNREAKWEHAAAFVQGAINLAVEKEDSELAEALKFAKLYAEGQLATIRDVGGMF